MGWIRSLVARVLIAVLLGCSVASSAETAQSCEPGWVSAGHRQAMCAFSDAAWDWQRRVLDFLMEHGNRPEFTFRFRWQKGSIAFWDNRSTKHIAVGDAGPFRRLMRRIQICGDRPV